MRAKFSPSASLEREVIVAVIVLYLLITVAMLAIHYMRPAGTGAAGLSLTSAQTLLAKSGYRDIQDLRLVDGQFRARAVNAGAAVDVGINPVTGEISSAALVTR